MTLGERLVYIRKSLNPKMNQTEFANSLGLSRSAYSLYEIDHITPSKTKLKLLCMTYNVNPVWLETGEGEPFLPKREEMLRQQVADIMKGESEFAISIMTAFATMPPEWWEMLEKQIDMIRENIKK